MPFVPPSFRVAGFVLLSLVALRCAAPPPSSERSATQTATGEGLGPADTLRAPAPARARQSTVARIPTEGPFRALVVFLRFKDDTFRSSATCARSGRAWPLDASLPDLAEALLAPSPTPPFAEASLTQYFYQQSRGRFFLYGDVYPHVLVTEEEEASYGRFGSAGRTQLTQEVLRRLDPDVNFGDYDVNGDGYLDQLILVVRKMRKAYRPAWSGISSLGGGAPEPVADGVRVSWALSGSINRYFTAGNIDPRQDFVRHLAHEFGHDLWPEFRNGHLEAIRQNDLPRDTAGGVRPPLAGYALMHGRSRYGNVRVTGGHLTLSAYERSLLPGWIECPTLAEDQTVSLGDLYATSDCRRLELGEGGALFVSNKQRLGFFDRDLEAPSQNCGTCAPIQGGAMATGLLVELVQNGARDVIPADGTLRTPEACEFVRAHDVYRGDLFAPDVAAQLTPWTRPNTSGLMEYPEGTTPDWQALDALRYEDGPQRRLTFDYLADFRTRPTVRADSWIGAETTTEAAPYTLEAPLRVEAGATLTVETRGLRIARALTVEPGATLVLTGEGEDRASAHVVIGEGAELYVPRGARLELGSGARVEVRGQAIVEAPDQSLELAPGAALVPTGAGRLSHRRDD